MRQAKVAVRHRTVVALKHERVQRRLGEVHMRAGPSIDLDVLLDLDPIVQDARKTRVFGFSSALAEPRGAKRDVEALPFAGLPAGVHARGAAAYRLFIDPAVIDAAAIRRLQFRVAEGVEHLDLQQLESTEEITVRVLPALEVLRILRAGEVFQALHSAALWRYFAEFGLP